MTKSTDNGLYDIELIVCDKKIKKIQKNNSQIDDFLIDENIIFFLTLSSADFY